MTFTLSLKAPTSVLVEGDICVRGTVWTTVYADLPNGQRRTIALIPSLDVREVTEKP